MNLTLNDNDNTKVVPIFQSGEYFFRRALHAYHKKDLQRAIKLLERAIKITRTEPAFQIQLASILTEVGEYERSNDLLHQVLEEVGDEYAECYFFVANNYVYLGYFEKAERAAERYLQLQPDDRFSADAYDLLDLLQMEWEDDWDLDVEEDEFIATFERAQQLMGQGDIEDAISLLQHIVEEHPTYWNAKSHLAEAYFRLDDEIAFTICEDILEEDNGNLFAICNLALFYMKKDKVKEASSYIHALKSVYPLDIDHYIKVAEVLSAVGVYDEAYKRMKKLNPLELESRPSLLFCQGVNLHHLGEETRAQFYMEWAAKLNNGQARDYLQLLSSGKDEWDVAYNIWYE